MSPDSGAPQNDEFELGPPARELAELGEEPSANFVPVLRRKIYRRTAASQFVNFTWNVPAVVFRELWGMAIELFKSSGPRA